MKKGLFLSLLLYALIHLVFIQEHSMEPVDDNHVFVLLYHDITENPQNESMIDPKDFKEHILWLKDNGYHFLSMKEFYQYVYDDIEIPKKSVLITFDDGYQSVYRYAYPIAVEYNIPMSFFIILKYMQDNIGIPKITKEELKEMHESDLFYIGNHTYNMHYYVNYKARLQTATKEEIKEDILAWNNNIQYTNPSIRAFSYPYGRISRQSIEALKEMKYRLAFTYKNGVFQKGITNPLLINRINVGGKKDHLNVFIKKITKYDD